MGRAPNEHRLRAIELRKARKFEAAIAELDRALAIDPGFAPAHFNIALVRLDQGRPADAIEAWRRAVAVKPDYWQAHSSMCLVLRKLGRAAEAVDAGRAATRIKPDDVDASVNFATALTTARHYSEAEAEFERALRIDPKSLSALNNFANLLEETDQPARATELYRGALAVEPDRPEIINNLGNVLKIQARIDEALDCYRRTIALLPDAAHIHSNLLMTLNCHPRADEGLLEAHVEWAARHAAKFASAILPALRPYDDQRIRIGYVSADFRRHSVSYFFEPLLAAHDTDTLSIFCYNNTERPDDVTSRLRAHSENWRDIAGLSDEAVAQLIRKDQIDILVDLSGHTAHNRLLVFARKPAPIQVSYLGYPNTTGMAQIDYRLTDAQADPPGLTESQHVETLVRLPSGFLCYRPADNAPPPRSEPHDGITFGTFNNFAKVTREMIATWSRILREVPEAKLLIKAESLGDHATRNVVHGWFGEHEIESSRVELLGREPSFSRHLALYHRVDVALDTFPYHGTTTTCEAMWMGVPVVTLAGHAHVSRVGVSLLSRVGLEELIASTRDQYVSIAVDLARNQARRTSIGSSLRERMRNSPLMDAPLFARAVEKAYRDMMQSHANVQ